VRGTGRGGPIIASLARKPATLSRSASAARPAAAAGLFSSWVSPADSLPSASSRSRSASTWLPRFMPSRKPSSRCTAIGYQRENSAANSRAGSASAVQSVMARTDAGYSSVVSSTT
jgi:hypothetical protein